MRVGIIGAGAIARFHVTRWLKLPVIIAGCYDRHPDRAAAFCATYGGQAYASLDELLHNVDLVTVCTPTEGHKQAVIAAAKARVAIVCEKPLARHLSDAEEMIAACEATNTPLFVAHVLRFFPEFSRAKATVDSGAIGKPGVIRTTRAGSFPRAGDTFYSPFYGDFARSGGVTLDLAIHDIDYQRWIAGDVERVFARGLANSGKSQIDQSYLLLRFRSGAIGHIDASWALPPGLRRQRLEIAGDEGLIEWDSLAPAPVVSALYDPHNPGPAQQETVSPLAERDEPYFAQLAHVFDALSHNKPFLVSPNDALMALKVALAALESIRSGQAIELDSFQESLA